MRGREEQADKPQGRDWKKEQASQEIGVGTTVASVLRKVEKPSTNKMDKAQEIQCSVTGHLTD